MIVYGPFKLHNNISPFTNTWLVTLKGKGVCRGSREECMKFIEAQLYRLTEVKPKLTLIVGGKS